MRTRIVSAMCALLLFAACNKKEQRTVEKTAGAAKQELVSECGKEIIADKPVKVGETGIMLPAGSKFCITKDNLEVRVELPTGFAFFSKSEGAAERSLPVFATYACYCSGMGSACSVFYEDNMGFGCLQSSCSGSCTGKFTYKGYSVDRVVSTTSKEDFFAIEEVQKVIALMTTNQAFEKKTVYGVSFYLVQNEKLFLSKASCDCEGTKACTLKVLNPSVNKAGYKIYYCDGPCNGCELTVN